MNRSQDMKEKEERKKEKDPSAENTIKIIEKDEPEYPERLRELQGFAPERLYCIGNTELLQGMCVAVVGSRKTGSYGKWAAYQSGKILAEYGIITVSGMAYGCDAEAHRGALENGGKTIAVLAGGADVCYPRSNLGIYRKIIRDGLVISENPPGMPPLRGLFPKRNRIISALSDMVVVAEAGVHSGSLITAGFALEQGREVMAFPGNITSRGCLGSNLLLRDGAAPVTSLEDLILQLGIEIRPKQESLEDGLSREERLVYRIIKEIMPAVPDRIADKSGLDISRVNAVVSILEIKGMVFRSGDRIMVAK